MLNYFCIDGLMNFCIKKLLYKSPHISIHDIRGKDKLTIYLRPLKAFQLPCRFSKWSECVLCFKWLIFHIPRFKRPKSFVISMKRWEKRQKRRKNYVFHLFTSTNQLIYQQNQHLFSSIHSISRQRRRRRDWLKKRISLLKRKHLFSSSFINENVGKHFKLIAAQTFYNLQFTMSDNIYTPKTCTYRQTAWKM